MADFSRELATRLTVPVVEDESVIRWAVAEALRAAGHAVLEAPDAATALRIVAEAAQPVDAVLLDVRLPDSSDLSLVAAIRRLRPEDLAGPVPGHPYSVYVLLHGVLQHTLYHAGQIGLLRGAARRAAGR